MSAATPTTPAARQSDRAFYEQTVIGQLLKAPDQLDRVSILEPADFASPDYRAWLTALRGLAKHRGTLTTDDVPAVIDAVANHSKRPVADVAAQASALIEQVWSTANTHDDAIRLRRLSTEEQLDVAMKAGDRNKTRELFARVDVLDAIKAGTKEKNRFTAAELLRMEFPDPVWLLPDLLPETGLYLLCGKPKSGKSWLALGVAMALAQGGRYLDRDTPQRKVCYLALEDTPRRLRNRLKTLHMGGFPDDLAGLEIRTAAPRLGKGLESVIRQAADDGHKVVILDTLQKIRPPASKNGTQYGDDYAVLGAIKDIADECGICILVIHHLRKAESLDDPFDDISGTNGVAGSADGALILRRVHGKPEATLHVTGRDMPDGEFGIRFDDGLWQYAGTAAEVRATAEQTEILDALKPYGSNGATIKQICEEIGKQRRNVSKLLAKLVDAKLVRVRRAKPADFFAICDGPMAGVTTNTTNSYPPTEEREEEERECVCAATGREKHKLSSTGTTSSIGTTGTTGTTPETDRGGTAGTGGTTWIPGTQPANSKANGGTRGNGGTAGTGGPDITGTSTTSTQPATPPDNPDISPDIPSTSPAETPIETATLVDKTPDTPRDNPRAPAEPLAVELAKAASLDIGRMLSGRLTEDDWSKLTHGAVKLSESLDKAGKDVLSTLIDRIDAAFNSQPAEVRS